MISAVPVPGQSCWSRMEQRAAEIRRSSWPWAMAPSLRFSQGRLRLWVPDPLADAVVEGGMLDIEPNAVVRGAVLEKGV